LDSIEEDEKLPPYWVNTGQKFVQPGSSYNMGVVNREEFKMLKKEWEETLPFQYFNFPYNKSLEKA
jgi:hypothetical protein